MILRVGDIAVLSESLLKFFNDFRSEEETEQAKNSHFLIVKIENGRVDALTDDGSIVNFTKHDLESIQKV